MSWVFIVGESRSNRSASVWIAGALVLVTIVTERATAQTSSLRQRAAAQSGGTAPAPAAQQSAAPAAGGVTLAARDPMARTIEAYSFIAVQVPLPEVFRVEDQVTVIVREQSKFESDADLDTKKEFEVESKIDAFAKWINGGLGSSDFSRGKPNIDYSFDTTNRKEADTEREDRLTTRIQAKIIDVKPNGNLVIEASKRIKHGEEVLVTTLTGTCRSRDVTPDNTILSTQVAELVIEVKPEGVIHDTTKRGWIPWLMDKANPF